MAEGNDTIGPSMVPLLQQELPQHVLAGFMRYQKIESLGRGGKAEVFLCRDQTLGREVAVKVLHPELLTAPEEQQMLVREARIMAAMVHPGIPKIHDLGRDFEGRPYFAMTYVPGTTFRAMLEQVQADADAIARQYHLQQCLRVLIEVGDILDMAHSDHVVHGDLKPENILIDRGGGAHLIDWGLATVLPRSDQLASDGDTFVSVRGIQGSPLYMSPEQASHHSSITGATDIYSLGVLLYECLTGTVPFRGDDVDEVLAMVTAAEPDAPRRRSPDRYLTNELEVLCQTALRKDPAERQASMRELVAALRGCHLELLIDYERAVPPRAEVPAIAANAGREELILAYV